MSVHAQTEPELPKGLGPSSCVTRLVGLAIGFGSVRAQTEPELPGSCVPRLPWGLR